MMSKIIYQCGNLLDAPELIIAHGCNAQGVMNSGVARAIREKWPAAYMAYRHHFEYDRNKLGLGKVIWANTDAKLIANCITQNNYGRDGKCYTDYPAVRVCMREVNKYAQKEVGVALPLIGAGLGGGDWRIISKIIEEEITHVSPVVYILPSEWDNFKRNAY